MSRPRLRICAASMVLSGILGGSCSDPREAPDASPESTQPERSEQRVAKLARAVQEAPSWVSIYDSERAWSGYTLDFFDRAIPILIDMNGAVVHSWPDARVRARLRLLPNGNLLAIGLARSVVEYDWDGDLVWEYVIEDGYAHHDVIRLATGNTMMIIGRKGQPTDDLLEVDAEGAIVWVWESSEFLADHFGDLAPRARDITHINSVQVLPANPWFEAGDQRFRAGNLLISARNLDAVFLIDRETKEVVWMYDHELDRQHEAMMIAPGVPGHGNIVIFNNGAKGRVTYRQSAIVEIDPTNQQVVWEYRSEDFFSPIVGVQEILPNGNVLIGSSLGLRNFEITRGGEIVWQWNPPFKTKRPTRYAYDFSPQMSELGEPPEVRVIPEEGYRHIDRLVYAYARSQTKESKEFGTLKRTIVSDKSSCREMVLPAGARARLTFGIDLTAILDSGVSEYAAEFAATLEDLESGRKIESMSIRVDLSGKSWDSHRWDLDEHAFRRVELCLLAPLVRSGNAQIANTDAYWGNPGISGSADREVRKWSQEPVEEELTGTELEVRQEHLKTLGYID